MTRHLRRIALGAALGAVALGLGSGAWAWAELTRPYAGWNGEDTVVMIEPGLDAGAMLERLGRANVVRRPALVRAWLAVRGGGDSLQAGEYRFDQALTPRAVLARLEAGDVVLHPVTLPEGLRLAEIAERFAEAGFGTGPELRAAFSDASAVRQLDASAETLEGYLFPDTYHFPRGESAAAIAQALVRRFLEVVGTDYADRARAVGLDVRQAVTLASMIEKETSVSGERPKISRVFHNRLDRGMRLECDPTVLYALHREGRQVRRLTYADLRIDSPFNTYAVGGLPPGPIASPGQASLEAAVDPAEGDELYFVAAPDGGHSFSRSLDDHLQAVAVWRRHQRRQRAAVGRP